MGFDKQLLQIREQRLVALLLPKLRRCFSDILVVTNAPQLYTGMGVRTVRDIIPDKGPLSGIHAALHYANSEFVYVMACDMPRFDERYARYLSEKIDTCDIAACVTRRGDWIEPFHAFYGQAAVPMLEADLNAGKTSVYYLLNKINTLYIDEAEAAAFTPDWSLFLNLNTREEYLSYLKTLE